MSQYSFKKAERLKKNNDIKAVLKNGTWIKEYPLRAAYHIIKNPDSVSTIKTGFVVSKSKVRSAVKRNLLKRRMREAFRLNAAPLKANLADCGSLEVHCLFMYNTTEMAKYSDIEVSTKIMLAKISKMISSQYQK